MTEFVLKKSIWTVDTIVSIGFGAYLGYELQVEADSAERHLNRILLSTFVGGISYLLAYAASFVLRKRIARIPSWLWLGIVGSIIYAFANATVTFSIIGWNPKMGLTIPAYVIGLLPYMPRKIIVGTVVA